MCKLWSAMQVMKISHHMASAVFISVWYKFLLSPASKGSRFGYSWIVSWGFMEVESGGLCSFNFYMSSSSLPKTARSMLRYPKKEKKNVLSSWCSLDGLQTHLCNLKNRSLLPSSQHPILDRNRDGVPIQTMGHRTVLLVYLSSIYFLLLSLFPASSPKTFKR